MGSSAGRIGLHRGPPVDDHWRKPSMLNSGQTLGLYLNVHLGGQALSFNHWTTGCPHQFALRLSEAKLTLLTPIIPFILQLLP